MNCGQSLASAFGDWPHDLCNSGGQESNQKPHWVFQREKELTQRTLSVSMERLKEQVTLGLQKQKGVRIQTQELTGGNSVDLVLQTVGEDLQLGGRLLRFGWPDLAGE